jgi:hypothetical protein
MIFLQATGKNNVYCLYRGPNLEIVAGDNEDIENIIFLECAVKDIEYFFRK